MHIVTTVPGLIPARLMWYYCFEKNLKIKSNFDSIDSRDVFDVGVRRVVGP